MKNILIIGAHFDDADLGVGGTAAKLAQQGCNVYKLTMTDNVTNYEQKHIVIDFDGSKKASALSAEVLGIKEIGPDEFPFCKCNYLVYSTEIMQRIEKIIDKYKIDTVFIHYFDDMNNDHREASNICLTAARHCPNILYYQSNAYQTLSPFSPTFFVDISDQIGKKREALSFYPSGHDRFGKLFETNIEKNHYFGFLNGVDYCEGFVPLKVVI